MRSILRVGGLALAVALTGRAVAEPVPYTTTVTVSEAEVRSGPSPKDNFYPTNRLPKGTTVQVLRERPDGWLEIRPPDGSFSWINGSYVNQMVASLPNNYVVVCRPGEKVEVRIGSELTPAKPTVVGAYLERSTQVRLFQRPGLVTRSQVDTDGTWLPIEPPAAEVRYLRAEAVAKAPTPPAAPAQPRPVVNTLAGPTGSSFAPAPIPATAPSGDKPTHAEVEELYYKAVALDRSGDTRQAAQLYAKVASMGLTINSPVAPQALARANYLLAGGQPTATVDTRFTPSATSAPTASVRLAAPFSPVPSTSQSVTTAGASFTVAPQRAVANSATTIQFAGLLRKSARNRNGLPTYVLESSSSVRLYVNPAAGVDLESYVGRNVEVTGTANYDGELRSNFMLASQVRPVQ
jgi:SH3-like domain-containing protein